MMQVIKTQLQKIIDNIDAGNSYLTEQEEKDVIRMLKRINNKQRRISKYEACKYLNVCRATFDNYVRAGKLPKGKKEAGFKELSWAIKDLDEFLNNN